MSIESYLTPNGRNFSIVQCVKLYLRKSMFVNDNIFEAKGFGNRFKNLGKTSVKAGRKLCTTLWKNFREL